METHRIIRWIAPLHKGVTTLLIGVDTWSYHRTLDPLPGEGPARTLEDLLPPLAAEGAEIVSLSGGLRPYLSGDPLRRLGRLLDELHLQAQVSAGAIAPPGKPVEAVAEPVLAAMDAAAALGATVCRVVTGWFREPTTDAATEVERTIAALRFFEPHARARGVRLALENHADFRLTELSTVLDAVQSEWIGVTFDIQNCSKVCDDPVTVASTLMPRIFTTHVRDSRTESIFEPGRTARYGVKVINCRLGEGIVPLNEVLALLAERRPDVPWLVESLPGIEDEHECVLADLRWLRAARSRLTGS